MKKKLQIITVLLVLIVVGVIISAPLLIESQKVQEQILRRINSGYVVDASVQNISFTWFPFPHVKMENIKVLHQDFSATSPQATLYPSWKTLFGLSSLGRLYIIDPVFQLHKISTADEAAARGINLPDIKIKIENGTLLLPEQQNSIFASQKVLLKNISASLAVHGKKMKIAWKSDANFAQQIDFTAEFAGRDKGRIKGEVKDLRPQIILADKKSTLLTPLDDLCTLSFTVARNPDGLDIAMQGDIPDISLARLANKENFRLGKGDLNLHLGPRNTFSLLINDLLLSEPQLQIMGEIAHYLPDDNKQANIKIDLKAKDIDLSAIRQKVLSLVGDNFVAQLVCDIVQGGKAHSASYFFDAPVESFKDVTSMTIKVDIAQADIHLGHIPLDLKNAQGPILIKDGDLTGKDITTWVGDAKGTAGVFLVGLSHVKHGLLVDVDIDANLKELPSVLRSILVDKDVVHELGMVQGSGRANGHLHIGDKLHDFNITVDVDKYQDAELRYDRLSWPLRPESGNLQVTDTSVTWQNIKAQLGLHLIQETSGTAAWDDLDIPLSIRSLHGLFDANTLLGGLQQYPLLNKAFSGVIASTQGSVEVEGSLNGPFFNPAEYTYNFDTKLKDIILKSPTIPEAVRIKKGEATIGHQEIDIISSSGSLFGKQIHVSGKLFHNHWQNWNGDLQMNGLLGDKHLNWLSRKNIFPSIMSPLPLYHVPNLNIRWDKKLFNLTGSFLSADKATSLDLDIQDHANLFSGIFRVKSPKDTASLTLHWHNKNKTFSSSFKGNISGTSLHALIDDSNFSFETISGNFKIDKTKVKKTHQTSLDFKGNLLAHDIHWKWGKNKRLFTIPTLDLAAKDSHLNIKELETHFSNESLSATGVFSSKPGSGHFKLNLTSPPPLTTSNIEKFQEDLDYFLYTTLAIKKEQDIFSTYKISGLLNFNLDSVVLPFGNLDKNSDNRLYKLPFAPLKGTYQFGQKDSELNLQNSKICGVGVNGHFTWHGPKESNKEISLMTPAGAALEFKDLLSCFNFPAIIEGPATISGRLHSDTKLCKRGGLLLTSQKGTIKKFVALAKTLSLINITGLSGSIWKEGFYYNALEISGNICDNIFTIDKAFIDGDGVDVVATGDINLSTMEYDLTFFVVPFATINGLVTTVPLVGRVIGGKEGRIISVPVKVTGPLDDPNVTVLSPSAIGEATGKWILDTITLPFGWMIPSSSGNDEGHHPAQISNQSKTNIVPDSPKLTVP